MDLHYLNERFDRILVINLRSRVDRWDAFQAHVAGTGLEFERWEGYGLDKMIDRQIFGEGIRDYSHIPSVVGFIGRCGCALAHRSAVRNCLHSGAKSCLILEDDARFNERVDLKKILECEPSADCLMLNAASTGKWRHRPYALNGLWERTFDDFWGWWAYALTNQTAMLSYLEFHEQVLGVHFDTAFRSLGFGEKLIVVRPTTQTPIRQARDMGSDTETPGSRKRPNA